MIISHKHKFIFVHIPRTGGTSTRSCLSRAAWLEYADGSSVNNLPLRRPESWWHYNLFPSVDFLNQPDYSTYFKWARVRNPWDRLVSIFHKEKADSFFCSNEKCIGHSAPEHACTHGDTPNQEQPFERWVDKALGNPSALSQKIWTIGLDYIARFENMQDDFDFFCEKVGLPRTELPRLNDITRRPYREFYNKKIINKLLNNYHFKEDLDFFNYEPEP